jgi:hypothetical protein
MANDGKVIKKRKEKLQMYDILYCLAGKVGGRGGCAGQLCPKVTN